MKTKYFIIGGAGVILGVLLIFSLININNPGAFSVSQNQNTLGNVVAINNGESGEYQEATLSMKNWEYVVTPSTLKKGIPVRMTVDLKTVVGCAQDVVIKDFGVRKYVKTGDNIIEFTPTKTGTITMACSMNMFFGSFQVVDDANSNVPAEVQTTSIPVSTGKMTGASCGMASSGGCGCGKAKSI